jgi:hypothetical protein
MSDTPETDNLARGNHVVPTEFAQQMERERNEARAYADKLADGLPDGMLPKDVENLRNANTGLAEDLHMAQQERDELRRERDEALVLAGGASTLRELANLHVEALLCWSTAERERDEERAITFRQADCIEELESERDQWRECAEMLSVALKELGGGDLPDYAEFVLSCYHKLKGAAK